MYVKSALISFIIMMIAINNIATETQPPVSIGPDVNRDGEVNILDLVLVAKHMGEEWESQSTDCTVEVEKLQAEVDRLDSIYTISVVLAEDKAVLEKKVKDLEIANQQLSASVADKEETEAENEKLKQERIQLMKEIRRLRDMLAEGPEAPAVPPVTEEPGAVGTEVEILSLDVRITEKNSIFWRHAWQLRLRNNTNSSIDVNATIEFQDSEGFIIDRDYEFGLILSAKETKSFGGDALITTDVAANVSKYLARIKW